jgi:hypothetical protein
VKALLLLVAPLWLAACGSFQDPNIVLDLRIIGAEASLPEQLVDVDLTMPPDGAMVLSQLQPSTVCALVSEPNVDERLHYTMTLCPFSADERCNSDLPQVVLARGVIDDPDTATPEPTMCATIEPDGNLLGVLLAELDGDPLQGLAGIDVEMQIVVGPEGGDPAEDVYGSKTMRVSPRIPAERTGNQNPSIDRLDAVVGHVAIDTDPPAVPLAFGRCVDQVAPLEVAPDTVVRITPVETAGAHEVYVVPTLEGGSEMFTESLAYQWLGGNGHFAGGTSGGPRDLAGNPAPLFTDWRAPSTKVASDEPLDGPTDVPIWVIQRDERFGVHWYESCIRVVP